MLIRKITSEIYQLISSQGVEQGELANLSESVGGEKVIYIVPASHCTHVEQTYARHEKKLLEKIIPWSLEEELIDRVDDLHFTIQNIPEGLADEPDSVAVCVIKKNVLNKELEKFSEAGIRLEACLSEISLLPWEPGQWTLVINESGECLVRFSFSEGLVCSYENLALVLQIAEKSSTDIAVSSSLPEKILLYHASQTEPPQLDGIFPEPVIEIQYISRDYSQILLQAEQQNNSAYAQNLLTGDFTPKLPWSAWWRQWRVAAILLVAIGALDLAARLVEINKLEQLNQQIVERTENVFRTVIPDGVLVDPQVQLQRNLSALQGASDAGFVALLSRAAPVIMNNPELEVQNLNYSETNNTLQLTLITSDFNSAESIRMRLQALGLQAELTGSTSSPEGSRSNLSISNLGYSSGMNG